MNFLKMHACCIPVRGAARGIIYDLQRNYFHYIPLDLCDILLANSYICPSDIKFAFQNECDEILDEYFHFLIENDYAFFCDNPESFPDIDLTFQSPELINNCIIDVDRNSNHNYSKIISELTILRCRFLELRFFDLFDLVTLSKIIGLSINSSLKNIDVYIPYNQKYNDLDYYSYILSKFSIVGRLIVHSSLEEKTYDTEQMYRLIYTCQNIYNEDCCGNISINKFSSNIRLFSESQNFNSCLNKKISIDKSGHVKNCPSLKKSYGLYNDVKFSDVLKQKDFTDIWNINKDQINVCKDCEYRYMCTDCRAFLDNMSQKPKKCNYDPYTATWA